MCCFQEKGGGRPGERGRSREQANSDKSILEGEGKCKDFRTSDSTTKRVSDHKDRPAHTRRKSLAPLVVEPIFAIVVHH